MRTRAVGPVHVGSDDASAEALVLPWLGGLPEGERGATVVVRAGNAPRPPARPRDAFVGSIDVWSDGAAHVLVAGDVRVHVSPDEVVVSGDVRRAPPWLGLLALALALRRHGLFHLHAGGAATGADRVLVVGGSGAGKTTTVLALLRGAADATSLGDDTLFLCADGSVLTLDRPFHATDATLAMFPELAGRVTGTVHEAVRKHVVRLEAAPRVSGAPTVLVFPEVAPEQATAAVPLSRADALAALVAQSALLALPGAAERQAHLALLARMVDGARSFALRLGADAARDPHLVARALGLAPPP